MTASRTQPRAPGTEQIATNRKARRDYQVLERLEAGIELRGAEVKSVRARDVSLGESFARIEKGDVILHGMHIKPYRHSGSFTVDPRRPRRLLLHRGEIDKLAGQIAERGRTLVPLALYIKRGRVKVELGLCQGKQATDKRETLRRKTAQREAERAIAAHRRR